MKSTKTNTIIFFILLATVGTWLFFWALTESIPFDSDESDKANAALELAHALKSGSTLAITKAIIRQSFYPPLHSLIIGSSYLVFSPTLASSRAPSVALYLLSILILYFTIIKHENLRSNGALIGTLLMMLSPILMLNSVLCMLEPLGVLLTTLLLANITFKPKGQHLWLALLSILFFLGKYTFAVTGIPACTLVAFLLWRRKSLSTKHLIIYIALVCFSVFTWLYIANRDSILSFLSGREQRFDFFTYRNLSLYFRLYSKVYSPHWLIGVAAFAAALFSLKSFKESLSIKLSWFFVIWTLAIYTVATTKGARHILFAAPAYWFLVGVGFNHFLNLFQIKRQKFITLFCCIVILTTVAYNFQSLTRRIKGGFEGERSFSKLTEFAFGKLNPCEPILTLGTSDSFSIEALRWEAARRCGVGYTKVIVDRFPSTRGVRNHSAVMNRNLGAPWQQKGVPVKPLERVIKANFYKRLLVIEGPKVNYSKYRGLFSQHTFESRIEGKWTMTVVELF